MFGIGAVKVLFTVLSALIVWQAFRWWARAQAAKDGRVGGTPREAVRGASRQAAAPAVQDLMSCPTCGVFVAAGRRHCGRPGCPFSA
jgi:hypothetical protein